jgi:hypothetical protein
MLHIINAHYNQRIFTLFELTTKYEANTCTVTNVHGNIGRTGKISNEQLCGFLQSMEKVFMKCIGILPLVLCNNTIEKIFHENKENYGKFSGK